MSHYGNGHWVLMMAKHQKRVRLKAFSYKGHYRYFITIIADGKKEIFVNHDVVEGVLNTLKEISLINQFAVWVYCFMPDHLHILIEGKSEDSEMRSFITRFKQKSAYEFKRLYQKRLWQENYHEHVLRKEEDTSNVARYILENPVRKGLFDSALIYPYLGSFEMDIKQLYDGMM